jgi:hypothetical protein
MDNIRNEIEVMKKVKHPHCIPLYNVYESANHIYIVMELVCVRGERAHESASARVREWVCARAHTHTIIGGELLDRTINKEH